MCRFPQQPWHNAATHSSPRWGAAAKRTIIIKGKKRDKREAKKEVQPPVVTEGNMPTVNKTQEEAVWTPRSAVTLDETHAAAWNYTGLPIMPGCAPLPFP